VIRGGGEAQAAGAWKKQGRADGRESSGSPPARQGRPAHAAGEFGWSVVAIQDEKVGRMGGENVVGGLFPVFFFIEPVRSVFSVRGIAPYMVGWCSQYYFEHRFQNSVTGHIHTTPRCSYTHVCFS
jgi:hypothetical protein